MDAVLSQCIGYVRLVYSSVAYSHPFDVVKGFLSRRLKNAENPRLRVPVCRLGRSH